MELVEIALVGKTVRSPYSLQTFDELSTATRDDVSYVTQ